MKSRVITFCVLIFCSELVASNPYPEELASLLRAFSTSGASSENELSNLEFPRVARSQSSSATSSGSLADLFKSESFQKSSNNYDAPLDLSSLTSLQSRDRASRPRETIYNNDNIQQRSNNYDRVYQNQPSVSEFSLQQEIAKQQQEALKNRLTNQLIQNEAYEKLIAEAPLEIRPAPLRRGTNLYTNSLPIQTLLERAKTVDSVPVRSKLVQQPPLYKEQTPILLDKLRQGQLDPKSTKIETGSQAAAILSQLKQSLEPISFNNERIIEVPQGGNVAINDPRIKEILNEVKAARERKVSAPQKTQVPNVQQITLNSSIKDISKTKTPPQATVVSSQKVAQGVNPQILPGSLKDIFSQLHISQGVVKSPGITTTATGVAPNPSKTPPKKRYLVIHPNGRREYIENLNSVLKVNPNYVLYTTDNKTEAPANLIVNGPVAAVASASASSGSKPLINEFVVTKVNSTTSKLTKNITPTINGTVPKKINATTSIPTVKKNNTNIDHVNTKPMVSIATAYASVIPSRPKILPNDTVTTKPPTTKRNVTIIKKSVKSVAAVTILPKPDKPKISNVKWPTIKIEELTTSSTTAKPDNTTTSKYTTTNTTTTMKPSNATTTTTKPTITNTTKTPSTTTRKPTDTTTSNTTEPTTTTTTSTTTQKPTTTTTSNTTEPTTTTTTSTTTQKPTTTTTSSTTTQKPTTTTTTSTTTQKPTTTTTTSTTTQKPTATITSNTTEPTTTTTTSTTTKKPTTTTTTSTTTQKPTTTTTTSTTTQKPTATTTSNTSTEPTSTTLKPNTTTEQPTTTTSKPNSTHPHHLTAFRVGVKKHKKPEWIETNVDADVEELLNKVTDEDDKYGVVYIFQIPVRPVIDRDVRTTIHPNGTVIEETVETVWEDENEDKPKLIRTVTVVHPEKEEEENKEE